MFRSMLSASSQPGVPGLVVSGLATEPLPEIRSLMAGPNNHAMIKRHDGENAQYDANEKMLNAYEKLFMASSEEEDEEAKKKTRVECMKVLDEGRELYLQNFEEGYYRVVTLENRLKGEIVGMFEVFHKVL